MALRTHFFELFAVAAALGLFSAGRFYMVSWLGERVTADLRNAVYSHVVRQSPEFFETTQTGEVLSRLTGDTTLVQTVVGSSLSMGLRNAVMGVGALGMLVVTNPYLMVQVLGGLVLIVVPSAWFGRRVRKLSRASQDRVADSSAIAAEVLNAIPVVQSYTAEAREAARFDESTTNAFNTAIRRTRARSVLVAFIIIATSAALLWGLYQGTQAVMRGDITAGHGAGRGVWRPAARRRRHRTLDGTAGNPLPRDITIESGASPRGTGGKRYQIRSGDLPLPVAPGAGRAERFLPECGARRNRGHRGPQRRG
jgi:ATP-binding cassette subfamily B protein